MSSVRRFFLGILITPCRVRRLIAGLLSWFLQWASHTRAWDPVSQLPCWLHRIANFIERFNAVDLPQDRDLLIADLVRYAVTDASVDRLIDMLSDYDAKAMAEQISFQHKRELIRLLKNAK